MSSAISHNIKKREQPKDIFITPLSLAKKQIDMIDTTSEDIWFDPFRNNGSYYNQFPKNNKKVWTEILEDKDFFTFNESIDIICSNPPYSMMNKVIEKCIELNPRVISLLIGQGNLTAKRIEILENAGYGMSKLHMCKVFKWYGMSYIIQFEKHKTSVMTYDRVVWK